MMDSALWRMAARNAGMWYFVQGAGGGVDVPLACCIVGVKAVLTGTAAGEVLHGHGNTLGGNAVAAALDAGDQGVSKISSISAGSSPKVPKVRCQRGSVTQSAMYM